MEQVRNDVEFDVELSLFVQITIICLLLIKQFMLIDSYLAKLSLFTHYENTPMQYTAIFHGCKNVHFQMKTFKIFLTVAQNIDCGYTLEPPR